MVNIRLATLLLIPVLAIANPVPSLAEPSSSAKQTASETIDLDGIKALYSEKAAISFLKQFIKSAPKKDIGLIRNSPNKKQELLVDGKAIFKAAKIGYRSHSDTGLIAIEAITGSETPIDKAEYPEDFVNGKLIASLHEIWLLEKGKAPQKLSLPDVNARRPKLSRNGRRLAFSGKKLNTGFPAFESLYVMDIDTGALKIYSCKAPKENFTVTAIDWVEDDRKLQIATDWGETGGSPDIRILIP